MQRSSKGLAITQMERRSKNKLDRLTSRTENGMVAVRGQVLNYYYAYHEALDRLADYEDAEEQGKLIVLPCNVGDQVWFIRPLQQKPTIEETTIEKVGVRKRGMFIKLSCNSIYETSTSAIGKSVFFSREEAEKALEGMR